MNLDRKSRNLLVGSMSFLGILCISSGVLMPRIVESKKVDVVKLKVVQKRVAATNSNEIKLKRMELDAGNTLSVDVRDYLDNPSDIDTVILDNLQLDTSDVNVNVAGSYIYTITYKKKIYTGTYIIKDETLPTMDKITLKSLSLVKGSTLSKDLSTYVVETIPVELAPSMRLDVSTVNVNVAGSYLYSISYNGQLFTSTILIYEPQPSTATTDTTKDNTLKAES